MYPTHITIQSLASKIFLMLDKSIYIKVTKQNQILAVMKLNQTEISIRCVQRITLYTIDVFVTSEL